MASVYEKRLEQLRKVMVDEGIDAFFLMMSSDVQYLTGILRQPHNPTDDDKHGDELFGAFITPEEGPIFLAPRMGASEQVGASMQDKPWVTDMVVIDDGDDPHKVLVTVLERLKWPKRIGISGRLWARAIFRFRAADENIQLLDGSAYIEKMRSIKDEEETRLMREAGLATDQVFSAVLKQMRLGMTEYDITREINHQIIVHGCQGMSFHTGITVAGHGIQRFPAKRTPIQPGSVISFDFGVIRQGYVSDFGRTVFCGEPTAELMHYHDKVMESQAEAIKAMKSGQVTASQLNEIARKVLDDVDLGCYFTHRLGHGIGIDVHEPPFLYELDHTVLKSGMCFTIEPSIRVPGVVGVRVEDVVQVTEDGGIPFSNFSRDYLVI